MFNATSLPNGSDERQQSGLIKAVGCWFESGQCVWGGLNKTAWQTWDVCDKASDVFSKLRQYLPTIDDADMKILENCVVTT